VLAAQCRTTLPDEAMLVAEMERTELMLRRRGDFGVHLQEHGGRRRRRPKP
jgi:hypothetical protein